MHVVAVDCPSGVDCETGAIADSTIPAEITVTMAGIKAGLIRFPAAKMTGILRITSIGSIENLQAYINNHKIILSREIVSEYLPERPLDAHKGTFGTALIVAGSMNYTGAALLAGLAAYRSGVGLVTMAVPAPLHESLSGQFPESTWVLLPHEMGVISADAARIVRKNFNRASAVLIGPGFGLEDTTKLFLSKLFTELATDNKGDIGFIHTTMANDMGKYLPKPIVMDADGLKLFSQISNWPNLLPKPAVLTPHPGEMAVLTAISTDEIQENRLEIASQYSKKWGHVVVLKGAFTIVADPDGKTAIVPIASPALARAGTGDVLAGLIVGLRGQGVEAFQAACAGAWIHATAGVLAATRLGNTASVIASDVINAIPQVISDLVSLTEIKQK
jgi:NAD(P)H-hydrate epimerase